MAVSRGDILTFENVQFFVRNFSGEKFEDGKRSFGFFLTEEQAEDLARDGLNVKYTKPPRSGNVPEDWEPRPWLNVGVSFKYRPPKIVQLTSQNRVILDEEAVGTLDWASIEYVDLSVRVNFYDNERLGTSGINLYLYELYVTIEETQLSMKYGAMADPGVSDFDNEDQFDE